MIGHHKVTKNQRHVQLFLLVIFIQRTLNLIPPTSYLRLFLEAQNCTLIQNRAKVQKKKNICKKTTKYLLISIICCTFVAQF